MNQTPKIWFDITMTFTEHKSGGAARVESELRKYFISQNAHVNFLIFDKESESGISRFLLDGCVNKISISQMSEVFHAGDVFFSACPLWLFGVEDKVNALNKKFGLKIYIFLYDLIPLIIPQWSKPGVNKIFVQYLEFISNNCDALLFTSKSSELDAEKKFHEYEMNIEHLEKYRIRLGDNHSSSKMDSIDFSIRGLQPDSYILYVSTIEARKNHRILYHVYHMLCSEGYRDILPDMVFVGRIGWGVNDLLQEISLDPVLSGKIRVIDDINDLELAWLYKNALFLVYPSHYEGWGLPVAEALSNGKAVIVSDNSSLPEVGGDCVVYVNSFDTIGWRNEILRLTKDSMHRRILERKVKINYKSTKWSETCEEILEVISGKKQI